MTPDTADGTDLNEMLDALPERIARYRLADLTVLYCNASKAAQYGLTPGELIGRPLADVLPAPSIAYLHEHLGQLGPDHRQVTMVAALEIPGSETRWIEWHEQWVPGADEPEVLSVGRDITDRVAHHRRLEQAAATEHEAADQLRRLDEVKNSFLNAVSHELRTPLTVVRGMAATLVRVGADLDGQTRSELELAIDRHATTLSGLLDELLDVDRLARGTLSINREPTDVVRVIRETISASDAQDRITLAAPAELWIDADAVQVGRIASNLLGNAAKYAPDGPIEVRLTERAPGGARMEVIDQGPGIATHERERVFEPFYRGDDDHPKPGTGIGLALVAEFARLHGGNAWVEPSERGAHLIVDLPSAASDTEVS